MLLSDFAGCSCAMSGRHARTLDATRCGGYIGIGQAAGADEKKWSWLNFSFFSIPHSDRISLHYNVWVAVRVFSLFILAILLRVTNISAQYGIGDSLCSGQKRWMQHKIYYLILCVFVLSFTISSPHVLTDAASCSADTLSYCQCDWKAIFGQNFNMSDLISPISTNTNTARKNQTINNKRAGIRLELGPARFSLSANIKCDSSDKCHRTTAKTMIGRNLNLG